MIAPAKPNSPERPGRTPMPVVIQRVEPSLSPHRPPNPTDFGITDEDQARTTMLIWAMAWSGCPEDHQMVAPEEVTDVSDELVAGDFNPCGEVITGVWETCPWNVVGHNVTIKLSEGWACLRSRYRERVVTPRHWGVVVIRVWKWPSRQQAWVWRIGVPLHWLDPDKRLGLVGNAESIYSRISGIDEIAEYQRSRQVPSD